MYTTAKFYHTKRNWETKLKLFLSSAKVANHVFLNVLEKRVKGEREEGQD